MLFFKQLSFFLVTLAVVSSSVLPSKDVDTEIDEYISSIKGDLYRIYGELRSTYGLEDNEARWAKFSEAMKQLHNLYLSIYYKFKSYPIESVQNEDTRRIIDMWTHYQVENIGLEERMIWIKNPIVLREKGFKSIFCGYDNKSDCNLQYVQAVQERIAKANSADELLFYWKEWRSKLHEREVDLLFELANNAKNFFERENEKSWDMYYFSYGRQTFYQRLLQIYEDLLPLYKELHAYVRYKLRLKYGEQEVPASGAIPQHLMDQLLAQIWTQDLGIDYPYIHMPLPNFTETLINKQYTGLQQAVVANEFYESIGMRLPDGFWEENVKSSEGETCSGTTLKKAEHGWEIDVCPKVDFLQFLQQYHNMIDLRYKMVYSDFQLSLNKEACSGFTKAVSKAVTLSVLTPTYLKDIRLLDIDEVSLEFDINRLYRLALDAVLAMPIHILHEKLLIELANGLYDRTTINGAYAQMLHDMAGVTVPQVIENYDLILPYQFLKGVGHAVPNTVNIFTEVMSYEFYKSLCQIAGIYNQNETSSELKDCDFYGHKEVGKALRKMFSYGGKRDWWNIAEELTGKDQISASGILAYFKPLHDWLKEQNARNNEEIGW